MTIGPQITIYTHHFGGITKPVKAWLVADLFPDVADVATFAVHREGKGLYPWHITNIETGFMVPGTSACSRDRAVKAASALQRMERILDSQPPGYAEHMKITHYQTIECVHDEHYQDENLDKAVNNAIAEGWQPFGGVSVVSNGRGGFVCTQAMVKYEQPATA